MAPFHRALDLTLASSNGDRKVYTGAVDDEWVIGAVPHGGYLLALLIEACIQSQADTNQRDPIHVSAHFLKTTFIAPYEIHVHTLKRGRGFTNISAELVQRESTNITAHFIFGTNVDTSSVSPHLNLLPPSPYARRIPLYTHPSKAVAAVQDRDVYRNFRRRIIMSTEHDTLAKNLPESPNRTNASTVGGGGLEWASWLEFVDKDDLITSPSLGFLADMFSNLPTLVPPSERKGLGISWFPTMFLAIDFKSPIPRPSEHHANRTVGLYTNNQFYNDGRHDARVEIWTAPSNFGEGEDSGDWRDKQVCLAVATQMAYTLPMEVNLAKKDKMAKL